MASSRDTWLAFAQWAADTPFFRRGESAQPSGEETISHHGVPQMPVMIDETETDPRSVLEFRGQALTTVVDDDAVSGRMLHIFTSREKAAQYVDAAEARIKKEGTSSQLRRREAIRSASQALTAGVPPGGGYIELYEDIDFAGCLWRILEAGGAGVTFNYATKWACGFLFWGWINADKMVSSIDCFYSADVVFFFDTPNLAGTGLFIGTGAFQLPNLVQFGWDNRISSQLALYF
jgi:hypothetical protein